jgi:NTE family protein
MPEPHIPNAIRHWSDEKDRIAHAADKKSDGVAARPKVGLALAGGFARGISHIGVLRVFRDAGIHIHAVAGTSVGALIGAAYCAGTPLEEMERIGTHTSFTDFGRWTPSWLGLATNQRLEKYLARLTPAKNFEDLVTPLAIAATDINAGITVYYTRGPILPPLRGSCAYPGLFVPIQYEDRTLVDGFLTSPVPTEGAALLGVDVVVAVYLEASNLEAPRTFTDVLSRSFNIIQRHSDLSWRQQADVIIEPDMKSFLWDDFTRTPELVAAGEAAARAVLPKIRDLLGMDAPESTVPQTTVIPMGSDEHPNA